MRYERRSLATSMALVTALLLTSHGVGNAAPPPQANAKEQARRVLAARPAVEGAGALTDADTITTAGVSITGLDSRETVSRPTRAGGQVLTVLRRGNTAEFRVDMPSGAQLVKLGQSVLIAGQDKLLGGIEAPWAVDARGRSLPSSYKIQGNRLIQTVDTRGATFPVVADPSFWMCDWYTAVCMKLNRDETRRITDTMFVGVGAAVGALCGIIPWMPPYLGAVKAACAGIVAAYFFALRNTFATAKAQGRCVRLKFNYVGGVFIRAWSVVNC